MAAPFEALSALDMRVHEPARLAILTALSECRACDFVFLRSVTALTTGNLSNHLQRLEAGGLVALEKRFRGKVPQTWIQITAKGRTTIDRYWNQLQTLRHAARDWGRQNRRLAID